MKRNIKNLFMLLLIISVTLIGKTYSNAAEVQYTDNVIPKMTSNTSPEGEAFASSELVEKGILYPAWKAFDHDTTTDFNGWDSQLHPSAEYLGYKFTEVKRIIKYTIIGRPCPANTINECLSQLPKDWTFEGSNDGEIWIELDKQSNISDWKYGEKKEFTFSNDKSYSRYRIYITANNGTAYYTSVGEIEMMEMVSTTPTDEGITGNRAILEIVMTNNTIKEYDVTADELNKFLTWFDNRSDGIGKSYYRIIKRSNVKPFNSRHEYLQFDKIYSFEVKDYDDK